MSESTTTPPGHRRRRALGAPLGWRALALLTVCSGVLAATPVYADPRAPLHDLHHASPESWLALALLALIGVGFAGRRRRSAAVACLALLIGVLGLESAVHSVHHLSDPAGAASCAVFSVSQNVSGTLADAPDVGSPSGSIESAPLPFAERIRALAVFAAHEGRAPPAALSA